MRTPLKHVCNRFGAGPGQPAVALLCGIALAAGLVLGPVLPATAGEAEAVQAELESLCSRTEDSLSMSRTELENRILKCRILEGRIQQLEETPKKVYSLRLRMCRNLYIFVLESLSRQDAAPEKKPASDTPSSAERGSSSGGTP